MFTTCQVYLSRVKENMLGRACFRTLIEQTESWEWREHDLEGFAPRFPLTDTMELLLGNNPQAKVMLVAYSTSDIG